MGPESVTADAVETDPGKTNRENPTRTAQSGLSPAELTAIVSAYALESNEWIERVRLRARHRWYERVYRGSNHDIWILSWLPGQSTGFHDHGNSSGAFIVASGSLEERRPAEPACTLGAGQLRTFGSDYAHDVRNVSLAPAVSIHAYSPPLDEMNEYQLEGNRLVPRGVSDRGQPVAREWLVETAATASRTVEQLLASARARLQRLTPLAAYEASADGAVLVDIRPATQRAYEGAIQGAVVIERNVLEWRLDPASSARLPFATSHDVEVIVFCSEGYTSSLAAASLRDLGLLHANDIVGGFQAWRAAGLPVLPPTEVPELRS